MVLVREGGGVDTIQTKQKRVAREQRNKYKPRTETGTTPSNQTRRQAGGLQREFSMDGARTRRSLLSF